MRDPLSGLDSGTHGLATHELPPQGQLPQMGVGVDQLPPGRELREKGGEGGVVQVAPAG